MMFTKLRNTVSYPVPQRSARSTVHSRVSSVGTMWPFSCSTGTVSVKVPEPWMRHVSVSGGAIARCSADSLMPPSHLYDTCLGTAPPRVFVSRCGPGHKHGVFRDSEE